eukprot:CAMPEP_0196585744 /NCGR_PEP_ID=MMETSP1081-20130531/51805_1 /TAXON_ID=36882 /ORGANISM="Pyramimonas amylifera, Strain CCMP720" /LENGTH=211 /DNA_ID=CAMNT_0041907391 /DNA_START=109 /DNA_END=744 /DNA_ORIENTATION=-
MSTAIAFNTLPRSLKIKDASVATISLASKKCSPSLTWLNNRKRVGVVAASGGFGKKNGPPKGKPLSKSALDRLEKGDQFDEMAADGKPVYGVFVRVSGPNQWFPVGPMVVDNEASIVSGIFSAEKDLLEASLRMYPALISKRKDPGLQYGYRLRDAPQMSEEEIRNGGNPFDNVVVATRREVGLPEEEVEGPLDGIKNFFANFEKNFTSGR